jgi:glycosyltransferase involved in cell wall biosynthesis
MASDVSRTLRIGVYRPARWPLSVRRYVQAVTVRIEDVDWVFFKRTVPRGVDVVWEPGCVGGKAPARRLRRLGVPVVVTLHGCAPFSLPWHENYASIKEAAIGVLVQAWHWIRWYRHPNSHVITVSNFARADIARHLPVESERIIPIHHGVDHEAFGIALSDDLARTAAAGVHQRPYLLHLAAPQPKKNLRRILDAYRALASPSFDLRVHAPGLPGDVAAGSGVAVSREVLPTSELAVLYQQARGFVFPSLHESFGMPILEAMAAGCPVVTSNTTGCAEVAGSAALTVDPRSVPDIAGAMQRIGCNDGLRRRLRQRGLDRVRAFTWEESARRHARLFRRVCSARTAG